MSIKQRNIIGTVLQPSGDPYGDGKIEFQLSVGNGTTPDDATSEVYVVGGKLVVDISDTGTVNFNLVPNDQITPAGTVWIATYKFPGGIAQREFWSVLDGAGTLEIGDVVRTNAGAIAGTAAFLIVSTFSLLPSPKASLQGTIGYVQGIAGEMDQEYKCMKGWDDVYRWVPATEGGGP